MGTLLSSSATNQERVIFGFRRLLVVPFRPWHRQQLLPLDSVYYTLCSPHLRADYTAHLFKNLEQYTVLCLSSLIRPLVVATYYKSFIILVGIRLLTTRNTDIYSCILNSTN